jgi:ATP-dependent Clp protease ATP-binding subunit ClpA
MSIAHHIPLSEDAALVTALAGTAMAFSHCAEDEAERWLRALRLHGQVGSALQALGVGEAPLEGEAAEAGGPGDAIREEPSSSPPLGEPALERTVREAERRATERGAQAVGTADLLLALLDVYGEPMDQALQLRGATRDEVIERLAAMGDHPELATG